MLVIISDLHFEETASNNIPQKDSYIPFEFNRNLPPKPFRQFFSHLASEASRNDAERLDLVLAGDIFDINRTSLWFTGEANEVRPYVSTAQIKEDSQLERRILQIIDSISRESNVSETLSLFRLLSNGRYMVDEKNEEDFPIPVTLHFIPGNHDRLVNSTESTRKAVRQHLGIPGGGAPFFHVLEFPNENVFVRHGHEYDRNNFSVDHGNSTEIRMNIPIQEYQDAPFGDFATIDIASSLPYMFRQYHGDDKILASPKLQALYTRLLEFDDLRPMSAMLNYFLDNDSDIFVNREEAWVAIKPVVICWLETFHDHFFLHYWLKRFDKKLRLDWIDAVKIYLKLKLWKLGLPLRLIEWIAKQLLNNATFHPGPEAFASREQAINNGDYRFLIAGHTHLPKVELIAKVNGGDCYYIDTGTWRNRLLPTSNMKKFGRLKALTYVIVYGKNEDLGVLDKKDKIASFDFWSGLTQRFEHTGKRLQAERPYQK